MAGERANLQDSVCLSVFLSICMSACLSVCLYVCLSVCLYWKMAFNGVLSHVEYFAKVSVFADKKDLA